MFAVSQSGLGLLHPHPLWYGVRSQVAGGRISSMSYRPYQQIVRRHSRRVYVGKVPVGGGAPISVQTMTNTLTTDVAGTVAQI